MSEWWFNAVSATEAIFTARTSLAEDPQERKREDTELFCRLCAEPLELGPITVKNITRLGSERVSGGLTPCRQLRPSSQRE